MKHDHHCPLVFHTPTTKPWQSSQHQSLHVPMKTKIEDNDVTTNEMYTLCTLLKNSDIQV